MRRGLSKVDALLGLAERSIALLDRARPLNSESEARRAQALYEQGQPSNPAWIYAYPPDLGGLRAELARVATQLEAGDGIARLYAERARELELEARVAEAIGSPGFSRLARQRYPAPAGDSASTRRAREWAQLRLTCAPGELTPSDASSSPHSLLSQLLSAVRKLKLPVVIALKDDLQSVAAVGDDTVFVKPGVQLTRKAARRIVMHEVWGHVLPRLNARSCPLGLLKVGSALGADDEEGRALLLEQRFGLMERERQVELGRRHLAAVSIAQGADWVEAVRLLVDMGAELDRAVQIACRAQRGGGLAREVVYLPAHQRVHAALEAEPELEAWLAAGRLSVSAARVLKREVPRLLGAFEPGSLAFELYE